MSSKKIKEHLLLSCEQQIMQKYIIVQDKIKGIVASLDDATKSSAGDKHETARAMLQLDREQAGERLVEIEKTLEVLHKINLTKTAAHAHLGSLVTTNKGNCFFKYFIGCFDPPKNNLLLYWLTNTNRQIVIWQASWRYFFF